MNLNHIFKSGFHRSYRTYRDLADDKEGEWTAKQIKGLRQIAELDRQSPPIDELILGFVGNVTSGIAAVFSEFPC
jgi:hypothetical protein